MAGKKCIAKVRNDSPLFGDSRLPSTSEFLILKPVSAGKLKEFSEKEKNNDAINKNGNKSSTTAHAGNMRSPNKMHIQWEVIGCVFSDKIVRQSLFERHIMYGQKI